MWQKFTKKDIPRGRSFWRANKARKPAQPMRARIIVDAKGSIVPISSGAAAGTAAS